MPKAEPSTRAASTVTLKIGLVPIALNIYSGVNSKAGVERHQYVDIDGEPTPVGRGMTNKNTGELLEDTSEVQSLVETEHGPVYVEDSEIETLFTLEQNSITVLSVQPQHLFYQGDAYVPKKMNFVEPVKVKTGKGKGQYDPTALKSYYTFMETLRKDGRMAVVEVVTRGVPKPAVLLPNGRLYELYHTDEVREQREIPEVDTDPNEVAAFQILLSTLGLVSDEALDLSDERAALINDFATEKAESGDFAKPETTGDAPAPVQKSVDLLAVLQASVDAAKAAS